MIKLFSALAVFVFLIVGNSDAGNSRAVSHVSNATNAAGARLTSDSSKVRIIMIGAHPDDCDQDGGGTAILFAKMGYAVKFVAVTNGDAGHQTMSGAALAKRRFAEAQEAGKRFGVTYDIGQP